MVWWPSLWGTSKQKADDTSGAYQLVSSTLEPTASTARQHSGGLSGIFVPVPEQDDLDELGALLDARKTIDAEIARHRRLASSHSTAVESLADQLTPDNGEQDRPDAADTTAVGEMSHASEHGQSSLEGSLPGDTLFVIPEEDENEESEAESTTASTPSTARQSRKRGRTTSEADDIAVEDGTDLTSLSLEDLDLRQDCFTVTNNSPEARSLDGCSVKSEAGGQVFIFPHGTRLSGGGGRVTVWSGSKNRNRAKQSKRSGGRSDLFWTARYVWNNNGDTAILYGPDEEELDRLTAEIIFEQHTESVHAAGGDESRVDSFLFIANLDLLQERVTICNGGADAVAMEGWQLRSGQGGQHFDFARNMAGHVVAGGAQLTLHSGKDGQKHQAELQLADPTNDHLFWTTRSVWADTGDTAILVAPDGIEVDRRAAKPIIRQHHEPPDAPLDDV